MLLTDLTVSAVCVASEYERKGFFDAACVRLLAVHTDRQGEGLGRKLLCHMLRKLREKGYKKAVMEIAERNTAARGFFEKFGFEKIRTDTGCARVIYTIEL